MERRELAETEEESIADCQLQWYNMKIESGRNNRKNKEIADCRYGNVAEKSETEEQRKENVLGNVITTRRTQYMQSRRAYENLG
ncbi:hypothetical protein AVEN_16359-1 [Araneus ventricosus]|uniref:Uncharacterized protein n=1 Tax=Araneus ventricosus TaxID=182803 RepID=A0A4Y2U1T3_ARAVE|nr:hypothetical protein AVEN_16359-1 [Araneus ventricosus]